MIEGPPNWQEIKPQPYEWELGCWGVLALGDCKDKLKYAKPNFL